MVKSGASETTQQPSAAQRLAHTLRQESTNLLQTRRLVQKTPVTPLQIHDVHRIVDPILVPPESRVAVLTDRYGQAALACGNARPHWHITGFVPDTRSLLNIETQSAPTNVSYNTLRSLQNYKPHAVVAVGWAHRVFSDAKFHVPSFMKELRTLLGSMPENGQLLIQDFALPADHDRFVVMDWADDEAAEALMEYATLARADGPVHLRGFFIEELNVPRAGIRRFRLPYKWAVESYHRWRLGIAPDAPYELTHFSLDEWSRYLEECGARVTYRAPHEATNSEKHIIEDVLQFYDEDDHPLPLPASTFTLVVEKIEREKGLAFYERRLSTDTARMLVIRDMPQQDDLLSPQDSVVEPTQSEDDVLPWYFDNERRLRVLVRTHVPRPVINRVARGTPNIDGRQWAGYLVEPLTMPHNPGDTGKTPDMEAVAAAITHFTRMPAEVVHSVAPGVHYYPAPSYLMQRVHGVTARLKMTIPPEGVTLPRCRVIDVLADDVLDAIACGLIPDGKLEILISKLMLDVAVKPRVRAQSGLLIEQRESLKKIAVSSSVKKLKSAEKVETYLNNDTKSNIRAVRSVFVEDHAGPLGRVFGRFTELDYLLPGTLTSNVAVCVPYGRDPMGNFLLADDPQKMPVPHRMGDDTEMVLRPSFVLPDTVKTLDHVRLFLAHQLDVDPNDLYPLGPSFFVHPKISAERVYPFLYHTGNSGKHWRRGYRPRSRLKDLLMHPVEKTAAFLELKAVREMGEWYQGFTPHLSLDMTRKVIASDDVKTATGVIHRMNDNMRPEPM